MNENKFFLINRGDLEGRLNAIYYKPERRHFFKKLLLQSSFVKLKLIIKEGSYGILPPGDSYNDSLPITFVRATEMKDDMKIDFKNTHKVEEKYYQSKRARIQKNDIFIAVKGATIASTKSIGFVGSDTIPNSIVNGSIFRFQVKDGINPKYIAHSLSSNISKLQMKYNLIANNAVDYLDKPLINNIRIYLPPIAEQDNLCEKYDNAIQIKNKNEQKISENLREIDIYLLKTLSVILPGQYNSTIENRIFKTGWQKVTGNRFDPKKYSTISENLIACIENSTIRKVRLKSLVIHSVAGDWGLDEKEEMNPKLFTKCLVIRATEFDNDYNLNIENSRSKFRLISNTKLKKLDIKPLDFLLEKSGGSPDQPVGRISILENELLENNTIAYSNFIHKFRVNTDEVLPEFLFCFLKTIHNIKLTDVMQSQTNGIRNLIMREYWNQSIILPDKKKQKEIADTIYQMRAEAKQTEIDALQGFEETKKEIEKLILE